MTFIYTLLLIVLTIQFILAFHRQISYYRTLTPVIGWLAGLFYFIVIPLFIIVLNEGYTRPGYPIKYPLVGKITTDTADFLWPFLLVWITLALTNLVIIFFTPKPSRRKTEPLKGIISISKLKKVLILSIGLSFVFFAINIYLGGGISNYFSTHWYYRFNEYSQKFGLFFTLYLKLYSANQIILAAATGLLLVAALKREWNKNYGLLAASLLTMVLHMVFSGNRIYLALVGIYFLVAMLSFLDPKEIIKYSLFLLPIVPIFSIWAYLRNYIGNLSTGIQVYVTSINQASSKFVTTLMDLTEGTNIILLFKVIHDFGSEQPLLNSLTYIKAFTSVLPDSLGFSTKSLSIILGDIYMPGLNVSMNSTAIGESWVNFRFFTLLFIPVLTFLIMKISDWFYRHLDRYMLLNSVLFVVIVWMARSVFADNFQIFIVSFLMIWGLGYEKNLYYLSTNN